MSSTKSEKNSYFFIAKDKQAKYLVVIGEPEVIEKFEGSASEEKK